ncbi:hypothetical protein GYA49_02195 [Candidatus Beckwithbacteria bacterium]|nr:hypothetical protein [Candidatus Beckwithbacteria bacterium]
MAIIDNGESKVIRLKAGYPEGSEEGQAGNMFPRSMSTSTELSENGDMLRDSQGELRKEIENSGENPIIPETTPLEDKLRR